MFLPPLLKLNKTTESNPLNKRSSCLPRVSTRRFNCGGRATLCYFVDSLAQWRVSRLRAGAGLKLTKQGTKEEVCDYAEIALKNREWSVEMLKDIVRYLEACERTEAANLVRDAARKRFPKAKDLP